MPVVDAPLTAPVSSQPFEHLVLDFLAYLEFERGLSRNTLEAYRSDLLQFGRFLEERGTTPVDAASADVADWRAAPPPREPPRARTWPAGWPRLPGATAARRRRPRPSTARRPACARSTAT